MENIFISLIQNNKIHDQDELKSAFRIIAKQTHPDTVGSDRHVQKFLRIKDFYEDAKRYLKTETAEPHAPPLSVEENYRFLFFRELYRINTLELSNKKNSTHGEERIASCYEKMKMHFKHWKKADYTLFIDAYDEYRVIRSQKHKNDLANLRKPSLYKNLRPLLFNMSYYHITGSIFYFKQLKRNLDAILLRLEQNQFFALKRFLSLLIEDSEKGPAVFD